MEAQCWICPECKDDRNHRIGADFCKAIQENNKLHERLEQAEARVAELEADNDKRMAIAHDALILRKQAEEVDHYANALAMWLKDLPGKPCESFIEGIRSAEEQAERQAQRLRQQAEAAEKGGDDV